MESTDEEMIKTTMPQSIAKKDVDAVLPTSRLEVQLLHNQLTLRLDCVQFGDNQFYHICTFGVIDTGHSAVFDELRYVDE